jgi:hypothetical protein
MLLEDGKGKTQLRRNCIGIEDGKGKTQLPRNCIGNGLKEDSGDFSPSEIYETETSLGVGGREGGQKKSIPPLTL